jgi:hypothetical protein
MTRAETAGPTRPAVVRRQHPMSSGTASPASPSCWRAPCHVRPKAHAPIRRGTTMAGRSRRTRHQRLSAGSPGVDQPVERRQEPMHQNGPARRAAGRADAIRGDNTRSPAVRSVCCRLSQTAGCNVEQRPHAPIRRRCARRAGSCGEEHPIHREARRATARRGATAHLCSAERCDTRGSKQEIWNHRCTQMHTDGPESGWLVHGRNPTTKPGQPCRCGGHCPIGVHRCASVVPDFLLASGWRVACQNPMHEKLGGISGTATRHCRGEPTAIDRRHAARPHAPMQTLTRRRRVSPGTKRDARETAWRRPMLGRVRQDSEGCAIGCGRLVSRVPDNTPCTRSRCPAGAATVSPIA